MFKALERRMMTSLSKSPTTHTPHKDNNSSNKKNLVNKELDLFVGCSLVESEFPLVLAQKHRRLPQSSHLETGLAWVSQCNNGEEANKREKKKIAVKQQQQQRVVLGIFWTLLQVLLA